jgi:hypothetical protein
MIVPLLEFNHPLPQAVLTYAVDRLVKLLPAEERAKLSNVEAINSATGRQATAGVKLIINC